MWKLMVICVIMGVLSAEGVRYRKRYAGNGAYAGGGAYAGTGGYTGGYTGGFEDDYDFGYAPDFGFGFIDPYKFHQQLTAQILAEQNALTNAIAQTYTTGDASVTAAASTMPDDNAIQNQIAQQHLYNKGYNSHRYAPNYAVAGGSIGPGGYTQTAFISPANPAIPNISNRFGGSSSPGGYKGVSVSSFSTSSNVNGQPHSYRGAQTTINDNGKITTYRVHS